MSKEKQIIEIKECIDAVYGADCAYFDVDGFAIAEEIYNAGYRKQSGWISVDERLPEECKNVLCFARNKTMIAFMEKVEDCGEYVPVFWDWVAYDRDDTYDEVCATHWMPLPEAPKETDDKAATKKDYYTPEEVRSMSPREVRDNIEIIRRSMKMWR